MTIALENDQDLDMALVAVKNYLLLRTNTIQIRKDTKIALNNLSHLNDLINAEKTV